MSVSPQDRLWIETATSVEMIYRFLNAEEGDPVVESPYYLTKLMAHFNENPEKFLETVRTVILGPIRTN